MSIRKRAKEINPGIMYLLFNSYHSRVYDIFVILPLHYFPEIGSCIVGQQENLVRAVLTCITQIPQYVPADQRFDLLVLVRFIAVYKFVISSMGRQRGIILYDAPFTLENKIG